MLLKARKLFNIIWLSIFDNFSNNFFVPEEILEIFNLKIGTGTHHCNWNNPKNEYSGFYFLVLLLQAFFIHYKITKFLPKLLHHILYFLSLHFNWSQMLLRDDVGVIFSINTSLDHEIESLLLGVSIVNANLVISSHECSKLVPELYILVLLKIKEKIMIYVWMNIIIPPMLVACLWDHWQ